MFFSKILTKYHETSDSALLSDSILGISKFLLLCNALSLPRTINLTWNSVHSCVSNRPVRGFFEFQRGLEKDRINIMSFTALSTFGSSLFCLSILSLFTLYSGLFPRIQNTSVYNSVSPLCEILMLCTHSE